MDRIRSIFACSLTAWLLVLSIASGEQPSKLLAQSSASAREKGASSTRVLRLPATPYQYAIVDLPEHFRTPAAARFDNTPPDNPVTDAGATLGRVLFYDTRLSANNTVACASCHVQSHGFADPSGVSKGFAGGHTDRHAMNLVNLRFHPRARFFWDERAGNLEEMTLLPIENSLEMGQKVDALPDILGHDPQYADLFRKAFGDAEVTRERIGRALAQFVRSLVSYQSRYDQGRAAVRAIADDFPNYSLQENRGKALFMRNCAVCHLENQEAHFVVNAPVNTGLDADIRNTDGGVGDITLKPAELGQFKSPSLRNVEVTGPYMHDGRFATLDAVIDHYSSGGKDHPNRDLRVQPFHFTQSEKAALIAFLKTLTDPTFLTDLRFSDPFSSN
ncbi:MAG TPA: cytochrome c peroxidase [Vicinamibacterales bacterium]|nr:cytochrome c peroxidase [Vicinamibacterales bacterium]